MPENGAVYHNAPDGNLPDHCPEDGQLLYAAEGADIRLTMLAATDQQFRDNEGFVQMDAEIRYCMGCGFTASVFEVSIYQGY
jgi:hypothetical protein